MTDEPKVSVLDQMTRDIKTRKDEKAAQLTPVGMEVPIPDVPGGTFLAAEAVADIERDLREQAAVLIAVADGLAKYKPGYLRTEDAAPPVPKALERFEGKDPETAAFDADFAAKAAAAQAATFVGTESLDSDGQETFDDPADDWVCPTHGTRALKQLTSSEGRTYMSCRKCEEYQKP
jgi:hypothetical protein